MEDFIEKGVFKNQVTLVHEPKLLGTAGTLINNLDFFQGGDGLFIHTDNYCLADFNSFVRAHKNRPSHCVMTMMTFRKHIMFFHFYISIYRRVELSCLSRLGPR